MKNFLIGATAALLSTTLLSSIPHPALAAQPQATKCPRGNVPKGNGCVSISQAAEDITAIARQMMAEHDLKAYIIRVTVGEQNVLTVALGDSMTGVPATPDMHFRSGSVVIAYLTTVLLQLHDQGKLTLDDPLSTWFPDYPSSDRVTLRMLANSTSGYADYVPNEGFSKAYYADVFQHWSNQQKLDIVFGQPMVCEPGTCFNYSHGNFVILSEVLEKVTGQPIAQLIQQRVLRPLALRNTALLDTAQMQTPVLHAFSAERGTYEESTYWNPSWTLGLGTVMTSDVFDVAKSMRAIGRGRLLSRESHAQQLTTSAANPRYGLGVLVVNDWVLQNPSFSGYAGLGAYRSSTDISIAIASTKGPTANVDANYAQNLFGAIATYLDPENPLPSG